MRYDSQSGNDIAPDTYEVSLSNADLSFLGLNASGSIIAGVTNGAFEIEVPQSSPLSLSFGKLGSISIYGYISTDGQFDLTGSVGFNLGESGVGSIYGSLTINVSNSGFSGSIDAGCEVAGFTLASVQGDLDIEGDYFYIDATVDILSFKHSFHIQIGQCSPRRSMRGLTSSPCRPAPPSTRRSSSVP